MNEQKTYPCGFSQDGTPYGFNFDDITEDTAPIKPILFAEKNIFRRMYSRYFTLGIHERINERQHRNALNINYVFYTVIADCNHSKYENKAHPRVNNGTYHHIGKSHSKYPKRKENILTKTN